MGLTDNSFRNHLNSTTQSPLFRLFSTHLSIPFAQLVGSPYDHVVCRGLIRVRYATFVTENTLTAKSR